jgi:hypothetical protein
MASGIYADYYNASSFGGYDGFEEHDNGHYDVFNDYYGHGGYGSYDPYTDYEEGVDEGRGGYSSRMTHEDLDRVP